MRYFFSSLLIGMLMLGCPIVFANSLAHALNQQNRSLKEKRLISLDVQNISIEALLKLLAEHAGKNLIVRDRLTARITLHLKQVPWQRVLEMILKKYDLSKETIEGVWVIRAKHLAMLQAQASDRVKARAELIQLNYSKVEEVARILEKKKNSFLSSKGNIAYDTRTNLLWIKDTVDYRSEIKQLIQKLDVPVKQVSIKARIVTIESNDVFTWGTRLGLMPLEHFSSTTPSSRSEAGTLTQIGSGWQSPQFHMDWPALAATEAQVGRFSFSLAKVKPGVLLDLELSALELEGKGKIIGTAQLLTANHQAAFIESGQAIPYQQSIGNGATSVAFKEAVLKLSVTPHLIQDEKIILDLDLKQDHASSEHYLGVPAINTKKMKTHALIRNGETLVLGGLSQQKSRHSLQQIRFLGKIPIVGSLFINRSDSGAMTRLIVFVTSKIIQ